MRNNQLVAVMVGLLFLCTCMVVVYTLQINVKTNQLRTVNLQLNAAANVGKLMAATFNEAANYSKTHPDIVPILQRMTNGPVQTAAPAAAPAATAPKTPGK